MAQYFFGTLMFLTSLFLILLVLVQRGRGGGLAGAFGGMGGQSAFGTKAGDLFTRVTMIAAGFWILLCVVAIAVLNSQSNPLGGGDAAGPPAMRSAGEGGDDTGTTTEGLPAEDASGGLDGLTGIGSAVGGNATAEDTAAEDTAAEEAGAAATDSEEP